MSDSFRDLKLPRAIDYKASADRDGSPDDGFVFDRTVYGDARRIDAPTNRAFEFTHAKDVAATIELIQELSDGEHGTSFERRHQSKLAVLPGRLKGMFETVYVVLNVTARENKKGRSKPLSNLEEVGAIKVQYVVINS